MDKAHEFSEIEYNLQFRSSYYILHTADYYLLDPSNKAVHNDAIIPVLKHMQDYYNHEIGWHNDLFTLQIVYGINPVDFLHQESEWLRSNELL